MNKMQQILLYNAKILNKARPNNTNNSELAFNSKTCCESIHKVKLSVQRPFPNE